MPADPPDKLQRGLDVLTSLPRRSLATMLAKRRGAAVRTETIWLTNTSGFRVHSHLHGPADTHPRPALVLVPGRDKPGSIFCGSGYLVAADELAARGYRVLHFDPVGRGRSWGHDDFCGIEGQDSLRAALDCVVARRDVDRSKVGVVSFSMGLALAAPVLAHEGVRLGVRFLLDWEGPADRESIVRGGPLPPAARTALAASPAEFWAIREPAGWIGKIPCAYRRLQARQDHASRRGTEDALALVAAATRGEARRVRLNDNDADVAWRPDQAEGLRWAPSQAGPLHRALLAAIDEEMADDVVGGAP